MIYLLRKCSLKALKDWNVRHAQGAEVQRRGKSYKEKNRYSYCKSSRAFE